MAALLLSLVVFSVLIVYKEVLDRKVRKHIPVPVPIDLIVVRSHSFCSNTQNMTFIRPCPRSFFYQVISSTVVSKYMHLSRDYSVVVMGEIPTG
jgi:hypothetical protein